MFWEKKVKLKEPVLIDLHKVLERTQENFDEAENNRKSARAREEQQFRSSSEESLAELTQAKSQILKQLSNALKLKSKEIETQANALEEEYKKIR